VRFEPFSFGLTLLPSPWQPQSGCAGGLTSPSRRGTSQITLKPDPMFKHLEGKKWGRCVEAINNLPTSSPASATDR
jgi:hypothetical protein